MIYKFLIPASKYSNLFICTLSSTFNGSLDPRNMLDPLALVGIIKTNVHGDVDGLTCGFTLYPSQSSHKLKPRTNFTQFSMIDSR